MLIPTLNEAVVLLEAGVASKDDIDTAVTRGAHQPMGPLELANLIATQRCRPIQTRHASSTGPLKPNQPLQITPRHRPSQPAKRGP